MDTNAHQSRRRRRSQWPSVGGVVTAAVVAYGTYRIASWVWNHSVGSDEQEEEGNQHQPTAAVPPTSRSSAGHWRVRRHRRIRCRQETAKALDTLLMTLRQKLEHATSTRVETRELKQLRAQRTTSTEDTSSDVDDDSIRREREQELWHVILVRSVSRLVVTAYAHSILFLVLTVQVNLLGGRLLQEQVDTAASTAGSADDSVASDRMTTYQESHKLVLQRTYEYFMDQGLTRLLATVERAVSHVMANWNVLDRAYLAVSREQLDQAIVEIRHHVEYGPNQKPRNLMRFLVPQDGDLEDTSFIGCSDDELAQAILDETWDLLESPVWMDAQRECLQTTFDCMRDQHWGTMFVTTTTSGTEPTTCTQPLAHVITRLKHTTDSFYVKQEPSASETTPTPDIYGPARQATTTGNAYCVVLETLPTVLELGDVSFN